MVGGVLCHTTTLSLLEIPSQNPIEVPSMDYLSSEVLEWSTCETHATRVSEAIGGDARVIWPE